MNLGKLQKERKNYYYQDPNACPLCGDMICRARIESHIISICKNMKNTIDSKTTYAIENRNTDGCYRREHYDMYNDGLKPGPQGCGST